MPVHQTTLVRLPGIAGELEMITFAYFQLWHDNNVRNITKILQCCRQNYLRNHSAKHLLASATRTHSPFLSQQVPFPIAGVPNFGFPSTQCAVLKQPWPISNSPSEDTDLSPEKAIAKKAKKIKDLMMQLQFRVSPGKPCDNITQERCTLTTYNSS